jgi:hypothetical protein
VRRRARSSVKQPDSRANSSVVARES